MGITVHNEESCFGCSACLLSTTAATPTPAGSAASSSFTSTARAISADDLDLRDGNAVPEAAHAEQAVIGALLRDNGGVDRMGALVPAQFLRADHRLIFAEVMRQIVADRGCDVISVGMAVADKLDDAMAYLNAMAQSCPSAATIVRYADLVRDRALLAATGEV